MRKLFYADVLLCAPSDDVYIVGKTSTPVVDKLINWNGSSISQGNRAPGLPTVPGAISRLTAAQVQAREGAGLGMMARD